jgi:hypothetical protein
MIDTGVLLVMIATLSARKYARQFSMQPMKDDSREMVNILEGDNIGHCP